MLRRLLGYSGLEQVDIEVYKNKYESVFEKTKVEGEKCW